MSPNISHEFFAFGQVMEVNSSIKTLSYLLVCSSPQNWLAFETLHRPLFSEHNNVSFPNGILPSKSNNFAFCQVWKCNNDKKIFKKCLEEGKWLPIPFPCVHFFADYIY